MLNLGRTEIRDLIRVYDDLYDYCRVSVENNLKPMENYYYVYPQEFNTYDPHLMDKAIRYKERVDAK